MPARTGSENSLNNLENLLREKERIALAYSGGMDSAFLLWACSRVLGRQSIWAVTFVAETSPRGQIGLAGDWARILGVRQLLVPAPEINDDGFVLNDERRCYYCKRSRLSLLSQHELLKGFCLTDGSQVDDLAEDRPGMQANYEFRVFSPLRLAGLGKKAIRKIAVQHNLALASLTSESCLATRIACGQPINTAALRRIDQAEYAIKGLGFKLVRARWQGLRICLEFAPADLPRALALKDKILERVKAAGFSEVDESLRRYEGSVL